VRMTPDEREFLPTESGDRLVQCSRRCRNLAFGRLRVPRKPQAARRTWGSCRGCRLALLRCGLVH
jgi:hypothetical protein